MQLSSTLRKHLTPIILSICITSPAVANDTEAANRLFVEAVAAWENSQSIKGGNFSHVLHRFISIENAFLNVKTIIDDFAGANLAVRLVIGEEVGPISLNNIKNARNSAIDSLAEEISKCPQPIVCVKNANVAYARQINADYVPGYMLGAIAVAELDDQLFEEALAKTDSSKGFYGKDSLLLAFAYKQLDAKEFAKAERFALRTSEDKPYFYERLVSSLLNEGHISQAQDVLKQRTEAGFNIGHITEEIAVALAMNGFAAEALDTLDKLVTRGVNGDIMPDKALSKVAVILYKLGFVDEAQYSLGLIQHQGTICETWSALSLELHQVKFLDMALECSQQLNHEGSKTVALAELAKAFAKSSRTTKIAKPEILLRKSLLVLNDIEDQYYRDQVLVEVSAAQANIGHVNLAIETTGEIQSVYQRKEAITNAMGSLTKERRYNEAISIIEDIKGSERDGAIVKLINAMAADQRFSVSYDLLSLITDEEMENSALSILAGAQAEQGDFDAAFGLVEKSDGTLIPEAFNLVIKALIDADLLSKAISKTMQYEHPGVYTEGFLMIAEHLRRK